MVLVLISIISGLVVQSSGILFGQYSKVNRYLGELQANILPEDWFRASVESLVASPEGFGAFVGRADYFEGYTLSAVTQEEGVLTRVKWSLTQIENHVELRVLQNDQDSLLIKRWSARRAKFFYFANANSFTSEWPAKDEKLGSLPAGILLEVEKIDGSSYEILAAAKMRLTPTPQPSDVL